MVAPGFSILFGTNQFRSMPAFTLRWQYERRWFISEGLMIQGFLSTPRFADVREGGEPWETVRPRITDGDHVSVRWRRLTVGGTWEHIQFREDEWKGGGRAVFRLAPHVSVVLYVLGPETEFRGGVIIHPAEKE